MIQRFFADRARADGPIRLRLKRSIEDAVRAAARRAGDARPSEPTASRVAVGRALGEPVAKVTPVQRQAVVAADPQRLERSLSDLASFGEGARLNVTVVSRGLDRGVFDPSSQEAVILGLGLAMGEKVARVSRLRNADGYPFETACSLYGPA